MFFKYVRMIAFVLTVGICCAVGCATQQAAEAPATGRQMARVHTALLNLLECPSLNCPVVEDLREGQEVAILTPVLANGWVQVRALNSGREGFVLVRFLTSK